MARLHFSIEGVMQLLNHAKASPEHRKPFGQRKRGKPCLILVGDEGIYLMSSGIPPLQVARSNRNFVVHARECDPIAMSFDAWWAAKQHYWGGDDGTEFIEVNLIEEALKTYPPNAGKELLIDITPKHIALVEYQLRHGMREPRRH